VGKKMKTDHTSYGIQLFDCSSLNQNELATGSHSNNICKNVTLWLKHVWYEFNKMKLPINENDFEKVPQNVRFNCKCIFIYFCL
jgi:hypothetical protein